MIKRCPYCNSIWVCWNWIHQDPSIFSISSNVNWVHECWDCEHCNSTEYKVYNGIPYWFLKMFWKDKCKEYRTYFDSYDDEWRG